MRAILKRVARLFYAAVMSAMRLAIFFRRFSNRCGKHICVPSPLAGGGNSQTTTEQLRERDYHAFII